MARLSAGEGLEPSCPTEMTPNPDKELLFHGGRNLPIEANARQTAELTMIQSILRYDKS